MFATIIITGILPLTALAGTDQLSRPQPVDHSRELVVLLHGFGRTSRDMRFLADYFRSRGYQVFSPTLNTLHGTVESCAAALENKLEALDITGYERVHLIGHSTGGLIIRKFLSENHVPNLGRCVLVGSPNQGTDLGALVKRYLPPLTWISPVYRYFQPGGIPVPPPLNNPRPEIGAIAGNGDGLLLGRFIAGPNDGRVPVDSVPFPGMTDFIVLPFHHEEIHHRPETAEHIRNFLEEGKF